MAGVPENDENEMPGVAEMDENVIEAEGIREVDFKTYSSPMVESLKEDVDKLILGNYPSEIIRDALNYCRDRNFMPSILCIACCELVGGSVQLVMPTARAVAILETLAVIQRKLVMDTADPEKMKGTAITVLAANALLGLAIEHIVTAIEYTEEESKKIEKAIYKLGIDVLRMLGIDAGLLGVVVGRKALNLCPQEDGPDFSSVHEKIFQCSAVLGAIVGGASRSQIPWVGKFGRHVGKIVDIRDTNRPLPPGEQQQLVHQTKTYISLRNRDYIFFDREKAGPALALVDYFASQ